mmetsp:Transcript_16212/g.33275  ORF Transcript_16212/g.33275 Transcript_16212/m.33275 type:complete len:209 (-) Transcript_16212:2063-2689(-)
MLTSLAPSPIASVITGGFVRLSLTSFTTSAFCFGLTLQQMQTSQCRAKSRNSILTSSLRARVRVAPSMTIACLPSSFSFGGSLPPTPTSFIMISIMCCFNSTTVKAPERMCMFMSCMSSLQEKPMLIAVSCLSPVRTQSFMPASAKVSIASGTPSCSLSSMAVAPTSVSPTSTSSARASCAACLPSINRLALCHFSLKALNSSSVSSL